MLELTRTGTRAHGPGSDSIFDADDAAPTVTIVSGPYAQALPVTPHTTVGEIRRRFGDRFDLDPNSVAVLDGRDVGNDTIVRGGVLLFSRRVGEKGTR